MTAPGPGGVPREGLAEHFGRFLGAVPGRLHFAAHSHHPWPDATFGAQQQAWLDAARLIDDKWDEVFGAVLPEAAGHICRRLGLSDPEAIAFAPSTHALVMRLLSVLEPPVRILTTDAEFHSFARQAARLEEDGLAGVERVPAEPFASFPERFAAAAGRGGHDLVYLSQVFFNSGYVVPDLGALVAAVPDPEALVVIDGYHGFMAVPTDLAAVGHRAFYLAGGYKYAMAGEGACFAHCPPGYATRPRDTGWFAGFADLEGAAGGKVAYAAGGGRLLGGTFDPTGVYRLNAVQRWLDALGVAVADIHEHVAALQARFLAAAPHPELVPGADFAERGHFLTFRFPDPGRAAAVDAALHAAGVVVDHRHDRLRIGFGVYHDEADVEELLRHLSTVPGWP
ncbi:MAG TPA: aminotransferase class V-fold PLP-dependent enzyme [Acidimicrobiia bacterium]|nr:aminotransferase class V-fold PLP-dependent enzyme [Acidimicrobiia bacterium]HZQ77357.1 aminotransferase class V-fold PLP-dependent enzyme [Acidimicrobiia bacterium]